MFLLDFWLKCAISLLSGQLPITRITFVALGTVPVVVALRGGVRPMGFSVYAPLVRTVIAWCHALVGVATVGDFLLTLFLFGRFRRVRGCTFRLLLFLPFLMISLGGKHNRGGCTRVHSRWHAGVDEVTSITKIK